MVSCSWLQITGTKYRGLIGVCLAANYNAPHNNTPMLGVHEHEAAGRAAFENNDVCRGPVNVAVIPLKKCSHSFHPHIHLKTDPNYQMRYVFLFNGGPLDGNAFHGDDESSPLAICSDAHRTFEETKNTGRTGIRFEMPNIDTPKDENGTVHRFIPHIYLSLIHI